MIDKNQTLALFEQVNKDEHDVKEVLSILQDHPRSVVSIDTLVMIWDRFLKSTNDFFREIIVDPTSDALLAKASLVRYHKRIFFDNIVLRDIYYGCSFLPDFSKYAL